jgi:hypothetical protein
VADLRQRGGCVFLGVLSAVAVPFGAAAAAGDASFPVSDAAATLLTSSGGGANLACAAALVVGAARGAGRWRRGGLAAAVRRRRRLGLIWAWPGLAGPTGPIRAWLGLIWARSRPNWYCCCIRTAITTGDGG